MTVDDRLSQLPADMDRNIPVPADLRQGLKDALRPHVPERMGRPGRFRFGRAVEVAAACLVLTSMVGMAAYRNYHSAASKPTPDECGFRETIAENLNLAADTLPAPTAAISLVELSKERVGMQTAAWTQHDDSYFRAAKQQGRLLYGVSGTEATLAEWANPSQTEPGYFMTRYRFPAGSLTDKADTPEVLAQLRAASIDGQVRIEQASTSLWQRSAQEYYQNKAVNRDWTLKDVSRWFETDISSPTCVTKTVPVFRNGPVEEIALPMLDLHNGKYVGFQNDSLITYAQDEGTFVSGAQTTWYTVPGLQRTDVLSGKYSPKMTPAQAKAEKAQTEADRRAKAEQLQKFEAELKQEEAKLAAMTVPKLEDVGEAAYTRAATENAAQGSKVKALQLEIGKLQKELLLLNPPR